MRKRCTTKAPLDQRETPQACLRKGIGVGKNLPKKLSINLSKDLLRDIARTSNIRGYSNMTKQQLYDALVAANVRTYAPR